MAVKLLQRYSKSKGFSLVELLVVMAIIAIALSIAVPSYRDFARSQRFTLAGNQLLGMLMIGRAEAIAHKGNVYVNFLDGRLVSVGRGGSDAIRRVKLAGVLVVDSDNGPNSVEFNPNGTLNERRSPYPDFGAYVRIDFLDADSLVPWDKSIFVGKHGRSLILKNGDSFDD